CRACATWPATAWATTGCWRAPSAGARREATFPHVHRPGFGGGDRGGVAAARSRTAAGAHPGLGHQRRDRTAGLPRATGARAGAGRDAAVAGGRVVPL